MMKKRSKSIVVFCTLFGVLPASFAFADGLTRAQVKKELADMERVGYDPSLSRIFYPCDVQTAERIVQKREENGTWPDPAKYESALSTCH